MSRSYKKHPFVKDFVSTSKQNKQIANRKLRRKQNRDIDYEIGDGGEYRKHTESWDIHDYVSTWPLDKALADWYDRTPNRWSSGWQDEYKTKEEFINWWKKTYLRK